MHAPIPQHGDVRGRLSRRWIIQAFNRLVLSRPYRTIGVSEVVAKAGVGRSTFYEHFEGKEHLLREALGSVLTPMAGVLSRSSDHTKLLPVLLHFLDQREKVIAMLVGPHRMQVEDALASHLLPYLTNTQAPAPDRTAALVAQHIAASQIGLVLAWLRSEEPRMPVHDLAEMLRETSRACAQRAQ